MITFALLLVQVFWLFAGFKWLGEYSELSLLFMLTLSAVLLVYIVNKDETPEFKLAWVIPICAAPVFGALLYLFIVGNWGNIGLKKGLDRRLKKQGLLCIRMGKRSRRYKEWIPIWQELATIWKKSAASRHTGTAR